MSDAGEALRLSGRTWTGLYALLLMVLAGTSGVEIFVRERPSAAEERGAPPVAASAAADHDLVVGLAAHTTALEKLVLQQRDDIKSLADSMRANTESVAAELRALRDRIDRMLERPR